MGDREVTLPLASTASVWFVFSRFVLSATALASDPIFRAKECYPVCIMQKNNAEAAFVKNDGAISSRALYQEVAGRLRHAIFSHEFEPGSWIDEQSLAKAYGISRTPMREALKVLSVEGLVTLIPRRGCYVAEIPEREIEEIFPCWRYWKAGRPIRPR